MNAQPYVVTWYAQGEPKPWRCAWASGHPDEPLGFTLRGEARADTYYQVMMSVADLWAWLQPEPMEAESATGGTEAR